VLATSNCMPVLCGCLGLSRTSLNVACTMENGRHVTNKHVTGTISQYVCHV
jgi:hypothetical protein